MFKRYTIRLQHDNGRISIDTCAKDKETAIRNVLNFELAPRYSILNVNSRGHVDKNCDTVNGFII